MGANAPPLGEKVRLERAKDERKKRQRRVFSSNLLTHPVFHSVENIPEVVDNITVLHVIDQYLSRPINGPNTIMSKGWFAVVFLDSVFLKTLKLHSQVKSLLKTSILNYKAII